MREERAYAVGLASAITVCGALATLDRGDSPRTVALGAATLLTIIGALAVVITHSRWIILRLRGHRSPSISLADLFFISGGLGWSLLLPGAAALIALRGEPGTGAYLIVVALSFITIILVCAGGVFGFVFLLTEKKKQRYALLAIVHVPAIVFLSIDLRLLVAAWRAI
jgi:hypothetical protein